MPLVVGIDEAGYGPTLGPLVVGATLWRVAPHKLRSDFWEALAGSVCRKPRRGEWRLHVNDSKAVFDRKKGLATLERPLLAFARAAELPHETLSAFIRAVSGDRFDPQDNPWYGALDQPLPIANTKCEAISERLGRTMSAAGVCCVGLHAEIVTEAAFNRRVERTRNKAAVLAEQVLRLIHRCGSSYRDTDLVVCVDRLGGRSNYRDVLAPAFPERRLHELERSETRSRYRLASERNDWYIEFAVDSDKTRLPVALASMLAKYLRECLMQRFNAYWRRYQPDLRPTAGYYTDARRFLAEIEPVMNRAGVRPEQFVRTR